MRKLCGFKGHSTHRGCPKCFKYFPGSFGEKTDYSGFDRDMWPPRHNSSHRIHAEMVRKASTQSKHETLATKYGVYYSSLLQLEYFNPVRFTAIDQLIPCIICFSICGLRKNLLSKKDLKVLEDRINYFDVGTGIGRLMHKNSIRLWWLHGVSVKELDIDLFHVLSERSFTRNSFKMLVDVCSCLPVSLYSSSVQDRHYKS